MANELKDTLNLPQTGFPMRADLVNREPERLRRWEDMKLYERLQELNADGEIYVLHDGPPFTNGDVHVGTALNKTLKDVIVRYKTACGYRSPYVPGWDCHGLPIEHKVAKGLRDAGKTVDVLELRQACKEFSESFIERQRTQFKRLGVLADWAREYRTMSPAYEATILRTFAEFVEKGLVYRSKKPVYWSIPCRTALAEAEVEYKDHVSPAVHVRFRVKDSGDFDAGENAYLAIWTTTPWTLPANLAIAVHPRETYREVKSAEDSYWVAAPLAESFAETCGFEQVGNGRQLTGEALTGWIAEHPFIERESPVLSAEYVTMEAGTGCVHTAPGHGLDDYLTGRAHGMEAYCPLADDGKFVDDGQLPSSLVGLSVLSANKGCSANEGVLDLLREKNALLHLEHHTHQYPHCWRSKTPVVFRAMDQWFVSLDEDGMRETVLDAIDGVGFTPEWGRNRIRGFLESRPDWCISRQRSWGVPIPVFHDEDGEPLLDAEVARAIADKVEKAGTDVWFEATEEELLDGVPLPEQWAGKQLRKGTDTLDVWIDSGCSHRAVLQREEVLKWPADLYLEGSDQHRGWFQSSLWTSMIADGRPPYKNLLTHGFVVDGDGRKISKSDGKPQTSDSFVTRFGADVVRLWVCSEDFRNDVPLSEEIFQQVTQIYRSLRNTLRFQLGNLHDFDSVLSRVPVEEFSPLDQWALWETTRMLDEVTAAYEANEFHKVVQLIGRFCGTVLSATYHDILKDRLYTLAPNDPSRRSSQTAIEIICGILVRVIGPITPFTADEAWAHHLTGEDFTEEVLCLQSWPKADPSWYDEGTVAEIQAIFDFKANILNEKLEELRTGKEIGQSLDAEVEIRGTLSDETFHVLRKREVELPELFIVSSVVLVDDPDGDLLVEARHAPGVRCPRRWRWVPELVSTSSWGDVSPRCAKALAARDLMGEVSS